MTKPSDGSKLLPGGNYVADALNGADNERAFVSGPATQIAPTTTLEEPTGFGQKHVFSPHTQVCLRCGLHAEDDAVENTPPRPG